MKLLPFSTAETIMLALPLAACESVVVAWAPQHAAVNRIASASRARQLFNRDHPTMMGDDPFALSSPQLTISKAAGVRASSAMSLLAPSTAPQNNLNQFGTTTLPQQKHQQRRHRHEQVARSRPNLSSPSTPAKRRHTQPTVNGMNMLMIKNLVLSQVILLTLATAVALVITTLFGGGAGFLQSLRWIASPSLASGGGGCWVRLAVGALAAWPMIFLSRTVDQAEAVRDASLVHFATTNMVLSLFGRRNAVTKTTQHQKGTTTTAPASAAAAIIEDEESNKKEKTTSTLQVILSSLGISALTSVTEEVVFRGYLPALILALTHSPLAAWFGQAVVFGLGHLHPSAQPGENRMVAITQATNAAFGYGLVYVLTGGDLVPCIVAHFLYDMHVLVSSWHTVNQQMDWTEKSVRQLDENEAGQQELEQLQAWIGPSLNNDTVKVLRRFFFAFDQDHKHALSLPNLQRAMFYAFLNEDQKPSPAQVENLFQKLVEARSYSEPELEEDKSEEESPARINLVEFVRLLFSAKAQAIMDQKPDTA